MLRIVRFIGKISADDDSLTTQHGKMAGMTKNLYFSAVLAAFIGTLCLPAAAFQGEQLASAAKTQIGVTLKYDPRYEKLAYPGGDVPLERGVCTDVVIRAYRHLGIDFSSWCTRT